MKETALKHHDLLSQNPGRIETIKPFTRYITHSLWLAVIGAAIFIFAGPLVGQWLALNLMSVEEFKPYRLAIHHLGTATLLVCLFLFQRRFLTKGMLVLGNSVRRPLLVGIAVVAALYLLTYVLAFILELPREQTMVQHYAGKTPFQVGVMILAMLIVVPVSEELGFRHFLLGLLPFNRSVLLGGIAVSLSSALFMYVHSYNHLPTMLLMFALGVVFAVARIVSGGMLAPVALHAFAVLLGLSIDALFYAGSG